MNSSRWQAALWAWGPVLVIMALTFFFSAQPKDPPPPGTPHAIYMSGFTPVFYDRSWETLLKKAAHMIGYGLLAVAIMRALRWHRLALRETVLLALVLAVSYAITDELHQSGVRGRTASVFDIGLDFTGAVLFSLAAWWIVRRRALQGRR